MKTDVVKGVNNKDNWGFGQERDYFFPAWLVVWKYLVIYPYGVIGGLAQTILRTGSWSDHPWQTEQPRDQYGTCRRVNSCRRDPERPLFRDSAGGMILEKLVWEINGKGKINATASGYTGF